MTRELKKYLDGFRFVNPEEVFMAICDYTLKYCEDLSPIEIEECIELSYEELEYCSELADMYIKEKGIQDL